VPPVTDHTACLVDVYDTVLTCDFARHDTELPTIAGVDAGRWNAAFLELAPAVGDGRLTMRAAYTELLRRCGAPSDEALVGRLLAHDWELVRGSTQVFADTVPFLEQLRRNGVPTAFVSNCGENTRPLLEGLGLLDLVDVAVLSCEVKSSKPDPQIYEVALRELGVPAREALFVDDQPAYCAGAAALGITTVCIDRSGAGGDSTVSSLTELADLF
jgi:putative hydrolase of the HAD superfamily